MKISIIKHSSNWTLNKRNKNNHKVFHNIYNNHNKIKYNKLKKKKNNQAK
jgi:hypothetical protein